MSERVGGKPTAMEGFVGEDLTLRYPESDEPVVETASVVVPRGAVTALIGPNGSGKSTLLKGLADELAPESGVVRLDGRDLHALDTKAFARTLGVLSQENVSPDDLTVAELVAHGRYPHRGFLDPFDERDHAAVERAIDLAGVGHLRDREMGRLSGGQKQLAWLAMVLAQETDVLLLDEPTTFLDLHHQLEVMDVIETLRDERDVTVLVVLHDVNQATRYADHVLALADGRIRARGPPEQVVTSDLLADVFDVEATVEHTTQGPQVIPLRPLHE